MLDRFPTPEPPTTQILCMIGSGWVIPARPLPSRRFLIAFEGGVLGSGASSDSPPSQRRVINTVLQSTHLSTIPSFPVY